MSTRAHRIDCIFHYQPAPIRAAFVPCHPDVRFCASRSRRVRPTLCTGDYRDDGVTGITDSVATSCQRRMIQIPIAMRSTLTPTQHPAVSSLEAYPTPAH